MAKEQPFVLTVENMLTSKGQDVIRVAWEKGKREIIIEDRKFKMELRSANKQFFAGGAKGTEVHHQVESWIVVRPTDGAVVPVAQIELKYQGNMRTVKNK